MVPVHVVATSYEGTKCSLLAAKRLAEAIDAQVVLIVPHVTSYSLSPLTETDDPAILIDEYRALASAVQVEATVRLCLCRRSEDVFRTMLHGRSIVVVSGHWRRWWPTAAQRTAGLLVTAGHQVVFVEPDARLTLMR